MEFSREFGRATSFRFPMRKVGSQDFAATGDWTPVTADAKISKDGGNYANCTNTVVAVGGAGSVGWSLTVTAAEIQAREIDIQIVDAATKAVEDQFLICSTRMGGLIATARGIRFLEVDTATFTATTTAAEFLAIGPNVTEDPDADVFIGRLLTFVTGDAVFEQTTINDSELANGKIKLTYDTLINTPLDTNLATVH